MKSWGIWGIFAVAMGMGISVAVVESGDSAAAATAVSAGAASKVEDHWGQTDLSENDLFQLVNDTSCAKDQKIYLACVNSVLSALKSSSFHLNTNLKIALNTSPDQFIENYTEKEILQTFSQTFGKQDVSFDHLWKQILVSTDSQKKKYIISLGINGFLSVAKDPHTYISPATYYKTVSSANEKSPFFLGISLGKSKGLTKIKKISDNSDAEKAGLKAGDRVISLNGQNVQMMTINDINQILRDKSQAVFAFSIVRNNKLMTKHLVRSYRVLSQVAVGLTGDRKQIGKIQLSKFAKGVCQDVAGKIQWLKQNKIEGLILDLKDNPGGLLSEASCLLGLFLGENKKAFSVQYMNSSQFEVVQTDAQQIYTGPLAIIVNQNSASASELLAGTLQEYKRATVLGERTFGKGTFQEIERWAQSESISYFETKGFYLLPSGASTQLVGVQPDIQLNMTSEGLNEQTSYYNPLTTDVLKTKNQKMASSSYGSATGIQQ